MLPLAALAFPAIDPVLIEIGPFAIRWYALAYVAGLVLGAVLAARIARRSELFAPHPAPSRADLEDLLVWAALGIVLGGRLGYVLFYNPGFFLENPLEIPQVWKGGMSFHGGATGLVLAVWLHARARKAPFFPTMDLVATVAPIGIFFGRLANFINGELYGRVTDVWWAVEFPRGGYLPRHPSQLYEAALEGLLLFAVLLWLGHRRGAYGTPGLVTGAFVLGYGLARFAVEFAREPDAQLGFILGPLTMGQLLSAPMILAGIGLIAWARRR